MTKSLNQSGAFLQIHIINQLRKNNWRVIPECPVHVSPFVSSPNTDPIVNPSGKTLVQPEIVHTAIRNAMDKTITKETAIDVLAAKIIYPPNLQISLCIESKKLNPNYVDWVFFQQTGNSTKNYFPVLGTDESYAPLLKIPPTTINQKSYLVMDYMPYDLLNYPTYDFGLALKNKKLEGDYYKSEKTIVDSAARQAMEGTYGFIMDFILNRIIQNEQYRWDKNRWFLPIIVTNANLYACKVNADKIDPQTGTLTDNPEYEKKNLLIYECPTPPTIQFPIPLESNMNSMQRYMATKWHILVCTPEGFNEFLKKFPTNTYTC